MTIRTLLDWTGFGRTLVTLSIGFSLNVSIANQPLGTDAARMGNYSSAILECQSSSEISINALYSVAYGMPKLPPGEGRDKYLDCLEEVMIKRADSLLPAFHVNLSTRRYPQAARIAELARARGNEIQGPFFVQFLAERADVDAKTRLAHIESLASAGNHWAEYILVRMHMRHACENFNGLCDELLSPSLSSALSLLERLVQEDRADVPVQTRARHLVDLARLYYYQSGPKYDFNSQECEKARSFALRGAQLGNACAMQELSMMFSNGRCQKQDREIALHWSRAQIGNPMTCPVW